MRVVRFAVCSLRGVGWLLSWRVLFACRFFPPRVVYVGLLFVCWFCVFVVDWLSCIGCSFLVVGLLLIVVCCVLWVVCYLLFVV